MYVKIAAAPQQNNFIYIYFNFILYFRKISVKILPHLRSDNFQPTRKKYNYSLVSQKIFLGLYTNAILHTGPILYRCPLKPKKFLKAIKAAWREAGNGRPSRTHVLLLPIGEFANLSIVILLFGVWFKCGEQRSGAQMYHPYCSFTVSCVICKIFS